MSKIALLLNVFTVSNWPLLRYKTLYKNETEAEITMPILV